MLLHGARGQVGPDATESSRIAGALARLGDAAAIRLSAAANFPAQCIDGRPTVKSEENALLTNGENTLLTNEENTLPRTAGGTLSAWAVSTLLGRGDGSAASLGDLARSLAEGGYPVLDHYDDHAAGDGSGCGAADHLATILNVFADASEGLIALVESWGYHASDLPTSARNRAREISAQLPTGRALVEAIEASATAEVPVLSGPHSEIAVVVNNADGTSIDRRAVARVIGRPDAQLFSVDTWAFAPAARALRGLGAIPAEHTDAQVVTVFAALNAATLLTLCAPTMPVLYLP